MLKLNLIFVLFAAYLAQEHVVRADYYCPCLPKNGEAAIKGTNDTKGVLVPL